MQNPINTSENELKVMAYDTLVRIQQEQNKLASINQELAKRESIKPEKEVSK